MNKQSHIAAGGEDNYLTRSHGLRSWIFTLDHKRIGVMYLFSILTFFFIGGILAILVRTELLGPQRTIMSAAAYDRVFTLHGAIMIFLFIIPGIPAALGNFLLPVMPTFKGRISDAEIAAIIAYLKTLK